MMNFSVVLSVYYDENSHYLNRALESIYDDQLLKPSQIVLIKDGALSFELNSLIDAWQKKIPKVLTVVSLENNLGLAGALNKGLEYCRHNLIARMDSDDVAHPLRFEQQIDPFKTRESVDVIGSAAYVFSDAETTDVVRKVPIKHADIIANLWTCPFIH